MKAIRPIFFLLVLSLLGCSSTPSVPEEETDSALSAESEPEASSKIEQLRKRAHAQYLAGNFVGTMQDLEAYLALEESEDPWVEHILYYCFMAVGQYKEALVLAKALVKKRPYHFLSYQQVGLAQLWMGQPKKALKNFKRALEFDDHTPEVLFFQGLAYEQSGKKKAKQASFAEAKKEYEEVLKVNPNDFNANYGLARLFLYWENSLGEVLPLIQTAKRVLATKQAEEDVLREKKLYLDFHLPLLEGIQLYHAENPKASVDKLLAALAAAPTGIQADLAEIYYFLGKNYQQLDESEKAQTFLEKALKTDPLGIYRARAKSAVREIANN